VVTSLRTDADYVVTEYGVAELRGKTLGERMEAMLQISHPKFRDDLRQASRVSD
jgi:4-hydroxybutyrate CoA-transferase